jgi:hypothetical protein
MEQLSRPDCYLKRRRRRRRRKCNLVSLAKLVTSKIHTSVQTE